MDFRPTREATLFAVAEVMAGRGTCSRAMVGVVVAHEGRILVTGYNGAPSGMPHCDHTITEISRAWVTPLKEDGTPGDKTTELPISGCTNAVHAEANAIAWAAKHGIPLQDAEMFTTMSPCLPCSQLIVNAGIVRVYYRNEYRKKDGLELLMDAGVQVVYFP